jgi:Fic family protein
MKPPYHLTQKILQLITSVSEKLGEVNANYLSRQSPQLRKSNRIKTIHSSLSIEGNTLSEEQITALLENKRVLGPQKDITEVLNAIKVYDQLRSFKSGSEKSFLKAHRLLMNGLIKEPGKYRTRGVGIVKGKKVEHVAPPAQNLPFLMKNLFAYLKDKNELALIKSCVFHYELEFIHPFIDGNGRMGRLWQTMILLEAYPVFEYLPFETLISKTQKQYYRALALSDKQGHSSHFIEYMLEVIDKSLQDLLTYKNRILKDAERLDYFLSTGVKHFSRKEYMAVFKDISTATASRDLKKGIQQKRLKKTGDKNTARYSVVY